MRNLRRAAILLLVLYAGMVAGASYHSHSLDPQVSLHCKICDFSQTFGAHNAQLLITNALKPVGLAPALIQASHPLEPESVMPGRSPPFV